MSSSNKPICDIKVLNFNFRIAGSLKASACSIALTRPIFSNATETGVAEHSTDYKDALPLLIMNLKLSYQLSIFHVKLIFHHLANGWT